MNKLIYAMLPLLFLFLCISAQSYKIAVLPFNSSTSQGLNQSIPDMIMTNLGNSNKFTLIETAQIDSAIQHFQTEQSEIKNDATAVDIGQRIGANAIISGNYSQEGEQARIDAHVVDVKAGTLIYSAKVQGLSNEIFDLVDNLSEELLAALSEATLNSAGNINYYFQAGNQLLKEVLKYEMKRGPFPNLSGNLNTGESLNLNKLIYPGNTDAINMEPDKTYQITFSGYVYIPATQFDHFPSEGLDFGIPQNIHIDFYGTDTFTLRSNETNTILVDIAHPPRVITNKKRFTKMKCELQVVNK